jgi:hypothetical protein
MAVAIHGCPSLERLRSPDYARGKKCGTRKFGALALGACSETPGECAGQRDPLVGAQFLSTGAHRCGIADADHLHAFTDAPQQTSQDIPRTELD